MALLSPSVVRPDPVRRATGVLPAWPLLVLFWGLPLIWASGALQFAPALLAVVMLFLLVLHRSVTVPWPAWLLVVFLLWMAASSVQIEGFGSWMGFALRWVNICAALIYFVYYWNVSRPSPTSVAHATTAARRNRRWSRVSRAFQ